MSECGEAFSRPKEVGLWPPWGFSAFPSPALQVGQADAAL